MKSNKDSISCMIMHMKQACLDQGEIYKQDPARPEKATLSAAKAVACKMKESTNDYS